MALPVLSAQNTESMSTYFVLFNLSSMSFPLRAVSDPQAKLHSPLHSLAYLVFYFLHRIEHFLKLYCLVFNLFFINIPPAGCKFHDCRGLVCVVCCCISIAYLGAWPIVRYSVHIYIINKLRK